MKGLEKGKKEEGDENTKKIVHICTNMARNELYFHLNTFSEKYSTEAKILDTVFCALCVSRELFLFTF